jgi:hypothetical protein
MILQIEAKTRQFIGLLTLGGIVAGMIFTGLIPAPEYQKYVGMLLGAMFYHVVRMLNGPTATNPTQPVTKE